jgi:hypothetical protein
MTEGGGEYDHQTYISESVEWRTKETGRDDNKARKDVEDKEDGQGRRGCRSMEEDQIGERLEDVRDYRSDGMYGMHKSGSGSGLHCKENSNYVFLFWELRGLSPNFHINVSVSHMYIPRIGPHISLQQNRQTDPGNI